MRLPKWFKPDRWTLDVKPRVTRFEVIDEEGRVYARSKVQITQSYQDDGRTLKVFVEKRH